MHRFHRSQSNKNFSEKKFWNCGEFRKFAKWPQTPPNVLIRWEILKTSSLPNLQIFEICKIILKIAKFFEKYEKNGRLTNFKILEICKILPKVTKCADSWRNTEKSEFAKFDNFWNLQDNLTIRQMCRFVENITKNPSWRLATPLELTAEWEVINNWRYLAKYEN